MLRCEKNVVPGGLNTRLVCEIVVRSGDVILSTKRHSIGVVSCSIHDPRRIEARDCSTRIDPQIAVDNCIASARYRRTPQDREAVS